MPSNKIHSVLAVLFDSIEADTNFAVEVKDRSPVVFGKANITIVKNYGKKTRSYKVSCDVGYSNIIFTISRQGKMGVLRFKRELAEGFSDSELADIVYNWTKTQIMLHEDLSMRFDAMKKDNKKGSK